VLLLVGAEGMSYEEAAAICGTKIGTIKSRMNRARARLVELLQGMDEQDPGRSRASRAALAAETSRRRGMELTRQVMQAPR